MSDHEKAAPKEMFCIADQRGNVQKFASLIENAIYAKGKYDAVNDDDCEVIKYIKSSEVDSELKAKDEVIKKLRGVAEFYANVFNWTFVENGDDDENCVILDKDMEGFPPTDLTYGGKLARSVLKDIGGEK